jgi:hypothetical protein
VRAALILPLLLFPATALAGNPWEELMGPGKPQLWTDPQGRFYLDLPIGFKPDVKEAGTFVDFWKTNGDYGYTAHVEVEMRTVPPGTKTVHFASRVNEDLKKTAPGYRVIFDERAKVSGVNAVHRIFTYQAHNNAQLMTEVVQYVFVVAERAFIISMITPAGTREVFEEDFQKMAKSFSGRAPGEDSTPMPKGKKKIRAGEMVNPDGVQY